MLSSANWLAGLTALVCAASTAVAQEPLTAARVLALTSATSEARRAESLVAEARGRLVGAGVWSERNPSLAAETGPRLGDRTTLEARVSLEVPLEPWGHRGRRLDAARAELTREEHAAAEVRRRVAGEALAAFYRALHAAEAVRAAGEQQALARGLLAVAEERHRQGDVPLLHVKLVQAELVRAGGGVRAAEQREAEARTALARVLGRPDALAVPLEGDLADRSWFDAVPAEWAAGPHRPDLRAAAAEVVQVRAELALAELHRRPETAVTLGYGREEGADVVTAGFSVSLPLFNRGEGRREALAARLRGARLAAAAARAGAEAEAEGGRRAYRAAVAALAALEAEALPLQAENARLAEEAYRAGKIDLSSLLLIRREHLELERAALDRRLDACLAGLELAVASGALSIPDPTVPDDGDLHREGE